ncbi:prepilin-type N-terminal cleavage/methylation domain-containing protein [Brevibacillus ginsengisoli]|uniref:prepilin-type N-terminal cleavage/methylation domain-containing protein n=1 Tax=Brevibacillus ginsengisoli TaxID=363854 RepID=UPI003CF6B7D6
MKKWLMRVFNVKDEKGLTLIELLAVIVILGIIAAIAIPAITGITNNTKKEAHKANAHQMVEAAKQMVAINGFKKDLTDTWEGFKVDDKGAFKDSKDFSASTTHPVMKITLKDLIDAKYFTDIKNPEKDSVYANASSGADAEKNVVYVYDNNGSYLYFVKLEGEVGASSFNKWNSPLLESDIDKLNLK